MSRRFATSRQAHLAGLFAFPSQCVGSFLAEQQVHQPATAVVWLFAPAMCENVGVVAAGVFEGVGQDRHPLEGALVIDSQSNFLNRVLVPGKAGGIDFRQYAEAEFKVRDPKGIAQVQNFAGMGTNELTVDARTVAATQIFHPYMATVPADFALPLADAQIL